MASTRGMVTERILGWLEDVDRERLTRESDRALSDRVVAVKRYQQRRFQICYADLLESPRYRQAAEFFLTQLYGPGEFLERDSQFARITPKLVAMLPADVISTVADLARLHATTEKLDTAMARALAGTALGPSQYLNAWQEVGVRPLRLEQIELVLGIGEALDRYTHHGWLMATLRLMRAPAHAAGLGSLQDFLETGLASFRAMRGAHEFLAMIRSRETALLEALFSAPSQAKVTGGDEAAAEILLRSLPKAGDALQK